MHGLLQALHCSVVLWVCSFAGVGQQQAHLHTDHAHRIRRGSTECSTLLDMKLRSSTDWAGCCMTLV